jgi:DNA-binding LacI/PurR family transcriptional regulator
MATRKDVAEQANVSISVVSRVMNDSGYVAKAKREAVLQAAEELNFRPDPVATSLKSGKTRQILFYRGALSNIYQLELYRGMEDRAQEAGYIVFMAGDLPIKQIQGMMIDGVILPIELSFNSGYIRYLQKYHLPHVLLGSGDAIPKNTYTVTVDTGVGMRKILSYLQSKGHRFIAYVGGHDIHSAEPRNIAFNEVMGSVYGNKLNHYMLGSSAFKAGDYYRIGEQAANLFVERKLDATAVACFNDDIAISFCHGLRRLGYRIPEDLSVTGMDGLIMGEFSAPPLTSLSTNAYELGRACIQLILDILEGKQPAHEHHLPTLLIERESVLAI